MDAHQADHTYNFEFFKKNTKDCPNIVTLKGRSTEVPWSTKKKIDFLFIDGWHESPEIDDDISTWLSRLKPNGILSGHDFNVYDYPDVCRAVIATSKKLAVPIKFFKKSSIWMIDQHSPVECPFEILVSTPLIIEKIEEQFEHSNNNDLDI